MTSLEMTVKYKDLGVIGGGSFGSIYKICRKSDSKIFVRKEVRFPTTGERMRKLVLDEIRVLSTIRHPNIVTYRESFSDPANEKINIIMEYCAKGDLREYIIKTAKEGNTIPLVQIWSIIDQVGLALFRCHHGKNHPQDPAGRYESRPGKHIRVYHRDLKPANIFLNRHGVIKLGDFGLCAIMQPDERMRSSFVGTPNYMAPEVNNEDIYSEKSESWGLGCIAHELTTLEPTFQANGQTDFQITRQIRHKAYPLIPPEYGTDLPEIISSCFSLDPEKRPGMKDILDHPYIVESRCRRQLGSSQTKWEKEEKRQGDLDRREEALQKRESDLLARVAAQEIVATEIQKRERAMCALDLKFLGRELLVKQKENTMLEDSIKWQKERTVMAEKWTEIKAAEDKNRAVRAKIEKGYVARRTELRKLERSANKRQEAVDREEGRQKETWSLKAADLADKEARLAAILEKEMEQKLGRKVESAVRNATKQALRLGARGRGPRSSVTLFSVRKNKGKRAEKSIRPKLWEAMGPSSTAMELGDTFYVKNGLKLYSGGGKRRGAGSSTDNGVPDLNAVDVGQSFYIQNA